MFESAAAYVVAISAMLFSGISALTLIHTVKHFDPPDGRTSPEVPETKAVATPRSALAG